VTANITLPGPGHVFGRVVSLSGSGWAVVRCTDEVTRQCRIRGKLRRKIWVRLRDLVLVEPWSFQNERGEILFRYTENQYNYLISNGYLKEEFLEQPS
jgi:translation initiation factor 1A